MTAPLAITRPVAGRVAGGGALIVLSLLIIPLSWQFAGTARLTVLVPGIAAIGSCGLSLVLRRGGDNSGKYLAAAVLWGVGASAAGLFPTVEVGPFLLAHLALALGELGGLAVLLQMLLRARAGSDGPPLVVDALMLGTALATAGWDAFARTGHTGNAGWDATTVVVLAVTSLLACSAIALAVEQPRLRLAAFCLTVHGVGTALAAICFHHDHLVAAVGTAVATVGGGVGLQLLPRDGTVRHGGAAAERAARRLEIASLAPGPILLVDIVLLVVSPRSDSVLFGMFVSVLISFTVRHAATARSIDRTTASLKFQALHDALTGLGNRVRLEQALTAPDHVQSLVLLDLVGLDDVNDVLGVGAGDALIAAAAGRVELAAGRLGGTVFRTEGAQFAVLLPGDPAQCLRHTDRLVDAVTTAPGLVEGAGRFPLSAVAGLAVCPVPGTDPTQEAMTPFVQADIALRDAKPRGVGTVSVYSGTVAAEHSRRSLLRDRLVTALHDGEIDVHFQPVVSFTTGRVEKFEALARWEDPVLGLIPPVEFIAIAEESNLVVALGEHVLRSAVRWASEAGVFTAGVGLAVNVSVVQLQSPGFSDIVRDILQQYRIEQRLLTLELTESVFLDDDSPAERVVTELADLGCQIAIDDFGTGYSAFGYLRRLPVHVLKIDRSLTQSMTEDLNGQSVVTCVVDLATRLGMTVIVEGVETDQQAAVCKFISAPLGQGWLYSAAVPRGEIRAQLTHVYPVPDTVGVDDFRL